MKELIRFLETADLTTKILVSALGFFVSLFLNKLIQLLKWLFIWLGKQVYFLIKLVFQAVSRALKAKFRKLSEKRQYKKTIKQIENKAIAIPANFLYGKTPDTHPELKKIFEMINNGELQVPEFPTFYQWEQWTKEHPELFRPNIYLKDHYWH